MILEDKERYQAIIIRLHQADTEAYQLIDELLKFAIQGQTREKQLQGSVRELLDQLKENLIKKP